MDLIPKPDQVASTASNVAHKVLYGGLADLRPMPRTLIDDGPLREVYHYRPQKKTRETGDPILIEPGPITSRIRANSIPHFETWIDWRSSPRASQYRETLLKRLYEPSGRDRFELPPSAVSARLVHALESPRPRARYRVTTPTRLSAAVGKIVRKAQPGAAAAAFAFDIAAIYAVQLNDVAHRVEKRGRRTADDGMHAAGVDV